MTIRLECTEGGARKFWEAAVEGKDFTARWGKIGTAGQTKTKSFASEALAQAELDKLVREKRGKGYVDAGGAAPPAAPPAEPPRAAKSGPNASAPSSRRVTTDAGIVALFDAAHFASIVDHETWEAELLDDGDIQRHVRAGHLVPLSSGSDGAFEVAVRVGELSPAEAKVVVDRSPPYLLEVAGAAIVGGIEFVHANPDAKHSASADVPKGRWAVTVCAIEGKKLPDLVALLAPAKDGQAFRQEIAPFDPKPKKEIKPGAPIRTWKQAAEVARAGDTARAVAALEQIIAKKPEVGALAALGEIRAYEHAWPAFFELAAKVLEQGAPIGNTNDEFLWLLLRAGRATGAWDDVGRAIPASKKWIGTSRIGAHLLKQVEAKGSLPDPPSEPLYDRDHAIPLDVREARFVEYIEAAEKRAKTPAQLAESRFFCAASCGLDDRALELYRAGEEHMHWDNVVKAAQMLARRGDAEAAWTTLERKLPRWWPLSYAQVAPLVLLCDEHLAPLMTEARRKLVLATPRGS